MGGAAVISFGEVRATKQWATLRQPLHIRCDQWRDRLAARLQEPEPTVSAVPETVWHLRQELTGGRTATRGAPAYCGEYPRQQRRCRQCHRCLKARAPVSRTVETMVGAGPLERP